MYDCLPVFLFLPLTCNATSHFNVRFFSKNLIAVLLYRFINRICYCFLYANLHKLNALVLDFYFMSQLILRDSSVILTMKFICYDRQSKTIPKLN